MWSSVWTLWAIPFARALDVTVLLDNWKMPSALWLFDVPSSCSSGELVSHIPHWKCRDRRTGWQCQGGSVLSVSGVGTVPVRRVLWYILHCFVPSAQAPVAFHTPLPFPSRCSACACRCSMDMRWQRDVLSYTSCVHPAAKSLEPFLRKPLCPVWQVLLVRPHQCGDFMSTDRSCLFNFMPAFKAMALCTCLLPQICTLTFLHPWVVVHWAG